MSPRPRVPASPLPSPPLRPCSQSSALRKAPHLLHGIPYNSTPTPVDATTCHSVTPARPCDAPSGFAGSVASRRTSVPGGERLQAQPEPAVTSADRRRVIPIHRKSLHSARQPSHHLPLRLPWQLATHNRQLLLAVPPSPRPASPRGRIIGRLPIIGAPHNRRLRRRHAVRARASAGWADLKVPRAVLRFSSGSPPSGSRRRCSTGPSR